MKSSLTFRLLSFACALTGAISAEERPLPAPAEFDPAKFLGKWFEVARLPTAMQPEGSLATAEYTAGEGDGMLRVRNTAFAADGELLSAIDGRAQLAAGDAKGRLKVGFGPVVPDQPNYCVLRVDRNYQMAVVGSPDRNSLWILSRRVPAPEKRVKRLARFAEKAGFDTSKLVVTKWPEKFSADAGRKAGGGRSRIAGHWMFHIEAPNGEQVKLPMELEVEGAKLTGRVGLGDDRWLEVRDGEVDGHSFRFTVERDRPQGGSMKYALEGKFAGGRLAGTAKTQVEGRGEVTAEWDADRMGDESP